MILSLELALALELSICNVTSFEKEVMQILVQIGRELGEIEELSMRNKGGRCTVVGAKSDSIGSGRSNTLPLPLASRSLQNCKLPTVLTTVEQIPPSFFKLPFENEPHKRP